MADLLLCNRSKHRLSECLRPFDEIPDISPERLRDLKMCATNHVTYMELEAISNALFPTPLINVIMDAPFHVREVQG